MGVCFSINVLPSFDALFHFHFSSEKGNKQTTVKELKNPTKTKPKNLGKKSNWQGKAGKSSGGTSSNIVHKDQGKLQGCFRPWSAVASGSF